MNLFLRLASAAVLLPIVIWLFAMGGWYLNGMIAVVTGIALFEYGRIVERDDVFARVLLFVLGMTIPWRNLTPRPEILAAAGVKLLCAPVVVARHNFVRSIWWKVCPICWAWMSRGCTAKRRVWCYWGATGAPNQWRCSFATAPPRTRHNGLPPSWPNTRQIVSMPMTQPA